MIRSSWRVMRRSTLLLKSHLIAAIPKMMIMVVFILPLLPKQQLGETDVVVVLVCIRS